MICFVGQAYLTWFIISIIIVVYTKSIICCYDFYTVLML